MNPSTYSLQNPQGQPLLMAPSQGGRADVPVSSELRRKHQSLAALPSLPSFLVQLEPLVLEQDKLPISAHAHPPGSCPPKASTITMALSAPQPGSSPSLCPGFQPVPQTHLSCYLSPTPHSSSSRLQSFTHSLKKVLIDSSDTCTLMFVAALFTTAKR